MTTLAAAVPRIARATSAPRVGAMVKTVAIAVTATHRQTLARPCHHEVSSMWADAAARTCSRSSSTGSLQLAGALPLQPGNHPDRDRQTQQVVHQLADRSFPQAIGPGQDAEDGPQSRAECPLGYPWRQSGTGGNATVRADQAVELVLINDRADRRQFGDLVTQRFGII